MDHEWLEEYMYRCVNSRNKGQPCKLFLPRNAIFPPVKNETGVYDFGTEIINNIFNKLQTEHKNTLLTLYKDNNGVKDYSQLKGAIINILEKYIFNYDKGYF